MTEGEQVCHGELAASYVVDADSAVVRVGGAVVKRDDGHSVVPEPPQPLRDGVAGRDDQDALHALLLQERQMGLLLAGIRVGVADDDREPRRTGGVLNAASEVCIEGVRQVEDHQTEYPTAAGA